MDFEPTWEDLKRYDDENRALRAEVERLTRERDELLRDIKNGMRVAWALTQETQTVEDMATDLVRQVREARQQRDEARALLQAATDNAFDAGAKAQGLEDSHRFVAMRKERDEARADYERARADFLRCVETQRAAFADAATDADLLRAEAARLREEVELLKKSRLEHSSLCEGSIGLSCDLPTVCDPLRARVAELEALVALLQTAKEQAEHERDEALERVTMPRGTGYDPEAGTCAYCHGVGACPRCCRRGDQVPCSCMTEVERLRDIVKQLLPVPGFPKCDSRCASNSSSYEEDPRCDCGMDEIRTQAEKARALLKEMKP